MDFLRTVIIASVLSSASAQESYELPPIRYSSTTATDPIQRLSSAIARGEITLPDRDEQKLLRLLLSTLSIPEVSQVLVYSKTSAQNYHITPRTPRALFFNEFAYVGHVPGGGFEIAVHDDQLGAVFYLLEPEPATGRFSLQRNTTSCLNCHATRRTGSVPGLLVRSVPTDAEGQLLLSLGSTRTDHRTPLSKRWAGYYVTGTSTLPHLGNRVFDLETGLRQETPPLLASVRDRIDTTRYLAATSDIVALMILEHQCLLHNLLINASMEFRRARWEEETHGEIPGASRSQTVAADKARAIADIMLFMDEAAIGDGGVSGNAAFQDAFAARFPKDPSGHSLGEFHLGNRLFKNRCSYMIYSPAFSSLPVPVKTAVFKELRARLSSGTACEWIQESERKRILEILTSTVRGFS